MPRQQNNFVNVKEIAIVFVIPVLDFPFYFYLLQENLHRTLSSNQASIASSMNQTEVNLSKYLL